TRLCVPECSLLRALENGPPLTSPNLVSDSRPTIEFATIPRDKPLPQAQCRTRLGFNPRTNIESLGIYSLFFFVDSRD
ncbi:MAG: hypothetical protein NTW75_09170, partial [Planctomycetales bacterium]|nr:hypothetical protein [Planctomycetales bacterium]